MFVVGSLAMMTASLASIKSAPAQEPPPEKQAFLASIEGPQLFQSHCATCHGKDATGGGPSASALKKRVPDLTRIAQRRGGKFPMDDVQLIISGETVPSAAHGSREMPIWGPIFSQIEWDQDLGKVRIYNLAAYLQTLQKR